MGFQIVTPPIVEPITLAEAKAQCRIDITDDDTLLIGYIKAAREWCELRDWRAYLTQTLAYWLDVWPDTRFITLPRPPLQTVSKVEYYDAANVKYTLSSSLWYQTAATQPGKVQLKTNCYWPTTRLREAEAICVTYTAGWSSPANMPERIRQAIKMIIGHWYENREAVLVGTISREIELSVRSLLGIDRAF